MEYKKNTPSYDQYRKLRWLTFFRALFAIVLLMSTAFVGISENVNFLTPPLGYLNGIGVAGLLLCLVYSILLRLSRRLMLLGYLQIIGDVLLATAVIYLTGGFSSIFSFLYILVIIYASMILYRRGGMMIAVLCSIVYGVMVDLQYYGFITTLDMSPETMALSYDWGYVLFRMAITIGACFGAAFLAGYLSEQEMRAKRDLWAMEAQVKRVERLAVIGEMAAGLAHEIKNPLASLSGSIQVLREEVAHNGDQARLMGIVLRETERISSLVNEFLVFARPQPGNKQKLLLDQELKEIVKQFQTSRQQQKIDIRTAIDPDIRVEIDPEHLRQVIWNLLLNAAEAFDGAGRIEIGLKPQGPSYACITISDNGCGIDQDIQQSIFDPFFTCKQKGTGLGLSIVQRILTSYEGLIDVESTPGRGSTFTVKLPRTALASV
jgi:two-component system sensor histidine kinase PilS (NtrC family)